MKFHIIANLTTPLHKMLYPSVYEIYNFGQVSLGQYYYLFLIV